MKDAFGGAFVLRIMIVFFVIFISFMVVAVNFAKTYRVKNGLINILERNSFNVSDSVLGDKIDLYLKSINYAPAFTLSEKIKNDCNSRRQVIYDSLGAVNSNQVTSVGNGYYKNNVCIVKVGSKDVYHYVVVSYMEFTAPFFNFNFIIPISGETRTINTIFNSGKEE